MEQKVTKVWAIRNKSGQDAGELLELQSGTSLANLQFSDAGEAQKAFQVQGYEVERVYGLEDECTLDDHRSCDLKSAAGMTLDWLVIEGKSHPVLQDVAEGGTFTESQLKVALQEAKVQLPEEHRFQVETLQDALWKSGQNG